MLFGLFSRVVFIATWPAIVICVMAFGLTGCTTAPAPSVPSMEELAAQKSHQLNIINLTNEVINVIRFKPCGKDASDYSTLIENLKPKQRVVFNLFEVCIDIKALNAFDQTLAERNTLVLSNVNIWDIQANPVAATQGEKAVKKTQ